MSEQIYTGENYKSEDGYWVIADDTNAMEPDKNYDVGKFKYWMFVAKLHTGKVGVWFNNQAWVTTEEVLHEYLPYFNPQKYKNCLALWHKILRDAYGYPYEQRVGYQIHHHPPINGLLALFYADRVKMPMTIDGQFCEEFREFFIIDNFYLKSRGGLIPVDKLIHRELSEEQRYSHYQADICDNINIRCNDEVRYPENDYYRFYGNKSYVNGAKISGHPRFSRVRFW